MAGQGQSLEHLDGLLEKPLELSSVSYLRVARLQHDTAPIHFQLQNKIVTGNVPEKSCPLFCGVELISH